MSQEVCRIKRKGNKFTLTTHCGVHPLEERIETTEILEVLNKILYFYTNMSGVRVGIVEVQKGAANGKGNA